MLAHKILASHYVSFVGAKLEKIVKVLNRGNDWKALAGWLDLEPDVINGFKTECQRENDGLAACYRRELVRAYCEKTGKNSAEVAHDIAHILERDMDSKEQADRLRSLFSSKLCSKWCIIASLPDYSRGRRHYFFPSNGLGKRLKQLV